MKSIENFVKGIFIFMTFNFDFDDLLLKPKSYNSGLFIIEYLRKSKSILSLIFSCNIKGITFSERQNLPFL